MFSLTLAQYEDALRAEYLAGAPGVTQREYNEAYPRGSRLQEWSTAIEDAARNGEQISPRVLDTLYREHSFKYRHLWHDYRDTAFPVDYLPPHAR